MLDRTGTLVITKGDLEKFESELKVFSKGLRTVILTEPPSADAAYVKTRLKGSGVARNSRGRSENVRNEKSPGSSNMTKSSVSGETGTNFLRRKSTDVFKPRAESYNKPGNFN